MQGNSQSPIESKLILDAKDIQIITGFGRTHTRKLLRLGIIPSFRIGSKAIRVSRKELEKWIDEQHRRAAEQSAKFAHAAQRLQSPPVRSRPVATPSRTVGVATRK